MVSKKIYPWEKIYFFFLMIFYGFSVPRVARFGGYFCGALRTRIKKWTHMEGGFGVRWRSPRVLGKKSSDNENGCTHFADGEIPPRKAFKTFPDVRVEFCQTKRRNLGSGARPMSIIMQRKRVSKTIKNHQNASKSIKNNIKNKKLKNMWNCMELWE